MEVPIIRIGNSKGIRLSKTMIERYQFKDKAEIIMREGDLLLRPVHSTRAGWENKFRQMHRQGEDRPLMGELFEEDELFEENVLSDEDKSCAEDAAADENNRFMDDILSDEDILSDDDDLPGKSDLPDQ